MLYRRENSQIWQCRYKVAGIWQRATTKEYKLSRAEERAKEFESVRLSNRLAKIAALRDAREIEETVNSTGMKFCLYPAIGGHVLEAAYYHEDKDEYTYKLYMIDENKDFAQQIAHAITLESLRG